MSRDGVVMVEVLAAIVILALAGVSSLSFVAALSHAQERSLRRERDVRAAHELLVDLALLSGAELAQRIGLRTIEPFAVWTDRPEPELYRVGIADVDDPETELLVTLLYRPLGDDQMGSEAAEEEGGR